MSNVANRLIFIRNTKSRRSFAEEIGVKESTLRNYEQGITQPTADFLENVCKKLSISPQWLLLGSGPIKPGELNSSEQGAPSAVERGAACGQCRELLHQNRELLKQLGVANERVYQAGEREKMLLKENAALQAENKDPKIRRSISAVGSNLA